MRIFSRWDRSNREDVLSPPSSATMQRLGMLTKEQRIGEARTELARAELAGELSELYVLNFQALLAMMEGSALANDYL